MRMLLLIILIGLSGCKNKADQEKQSSALPIEKIVEDILHARFSGESLDPISRKYDSISIDDAYRMQDLLAQRLDSTYGPVTGYKIAFAVKEDFEKYGISEPVTAPLHKGMMIATGDTIDSEAFNLFIIEAEIVFTIGKTIDSFIEDTVVLKKYIQSVHIGFDIGDELYDVSNFPRSVPDYVAAGGGAKHFVVGAALDLKDLDLNSLMIRLFVNDELASEGPGRNLYGNPWNVMLWAINHLVKRGKILEPGDIILSGKVSHAFKASPELAMGKYVGEAGKLGKISCFVK